MIASLLAPDFQTPIRLRSIAAHDTPATPYTRDMDVRRGMRFASETENGETKVFTVHEVEDKGGEVTIYLRDDRGNVVPARPAEFEDGPDGEVPKYLEDE